MHVINWKTQAVNDLTKIGKRIAKHSLASAEKMVDLIEEKVKVLADYADFGRIGRKPGTRELVVHETYIVIYRVVSTNKVDVLRVKNTSQQWP